ncbi:MAG: ATP-binding protein [Candidatus Paceibacterota bacterium]
MTTVSGKSPKVEEAEIRFVQGNVLRHLSNTYPTLLEVVLESVQNAIDRDVEATEVWITINYKTRNIFVRDNGRGTTIERFNAALRSVSGEHRKGQGSLGQFGLGLMSPFGKCERFEFTSCPTPNQSAASEGTTFNKWTFVCKELMAQTERLAGTRSVREDLVFGKPELGKQTVPWRTEMAIWNFTRDRIMSDIPIDKLVSEIQTRYGTTMRRNKVKVQLRITRENGHEEVRSDVMAKDFAGRPLPICVLENDDAGKITFRLFTVTNTKKKRDGKISVGVTGNDFRFSFGLFARSASDFIRRDVIEALSSGYFEGEILAEKISLHADRKAFVADDARTGFCLAIETWFDRIGSKHYEEVRHSHQEQRLQRLGLQSMQWIEFMLRDPKNAPFLQVLKDLRRGTIGEGHAPLPTRKVLGRQDQPALSVDAQKAPPSASTADSGWSKSVSERKSHTPLTVAGPNGRVRKVVANSSLGLQLAHEPMVGSSDLWEFDSTSGVLTFNIRHPHWQACDVNDTSLMRLQELVVIQVLTLYTLPEHMRPFNMKFVEEQNHALVSWILNADKLRVLKNTSDDKRTKTK